VKSGYAYGIGMVVRVAWTWLLLRAVGGSCRFARVLVEKQRKCPAGTGIEAFPSACQIAEAEWFGPRFVLRGRCAALARKGMTR
jgi:hypothetical protein